MPNNTITSITSNNEDYNLGALFDNVYLENNNDYSLKHFYNYLANMSYAQYSNVAPVGNNIKIWYDTSGNDEPENTTNN